MNNKIELLSAESIIPFEDNPYKVIDNEEMTELIESVRANGILVPLSVRPLDSGGYEVISGHRRLYAAKAAGLETVPALIYALDRDSAAIALVDSNLHREHLLPSEKAFAYKLKMEAMSRQGKRTDLTSDQLGPKLTANEISTGDSASQVKRYIRLTYLVPELLELVDQSRIAFTPAVELSYLTEQEQYDLLEAIECEDCTPSLSQSQRMKRLSQEGRLNAAVITAILSEEKPNQKEKLRLPAERVREYFPSGYAAQQMEDTIFKLLEQWHRQQQRKKNDAR